MNNLAVMLHAKVRHTKAETLMRRVLAIGEQFYGAEHLNVAIRLNNLALLLQATKRLAEAEPLMRRHVAIFLDFTRNTGHEHSRLRAAFGSYATLLKAMGRSQSDVDAALQKLMAE